MKISVLLGTRPEVIKLAPVIREARHRGHEVEIISTGQHRELIEPLFRFFGFEADIDLKVMRRDQDLVELSARILSGLAEKGAARNAAHLIVQGDTTSAAMGAYFGFCRRIPVAHVEAGLRTGDLNSPFPEEANRQLIGRTAAMHFAPTVQSALSLSIENIPRHKVHVVGNTVVDAVTMTLESLRGDANAEEFRLGRELINQIGDSPFVLITAHRRENHRGGVERICDAVRRASRDLPHHKFVFPVHPNPNVRDTVYREFEHEAQVVLCEPQQYPAFIELMSRAAIILTDSGGVQEEAASLGKKVLVMRENTERGEGVDAGVAVLVGTDPDKIAGTLADYLRNPASSPAAMENPYGDGRSAQKIVELLELSLEGKPEMALAS